MSNYPNTAKDNTEQGIDYMEDVEQSHHLAINRFWETANNEIDVAAFDYLVALGEQPTELRLTEVMQAVITPLTKVITVATDRSKRYELLDNAIQALATEAVDHFDRHETGLLVNTMRSIYSGITGKTNRSDYMEAYKQRYLVPTPGMSRFNGNNGYLIDSIER